MPLVPGLRSSYSLVGSLVYFGRMLDKIRLHAAGKLPSDYHANLGIGFDARTCGFLGIAYETLKTRTLAGGCDEEILAWAHQQGGPRSEADRTQWNRFMTKIGWRDDRSAILRERIVACGLQNHVHPVETFFDLNDCDEGRDPVAARSWEFKEPRVILIMGVSGSGKTTVGRVLAQTLGWQFTDADDFHPPANIAKMSAGIALDDADRAPWLAALRTHIDARLDAGENAVIACSALKQNYRDLLIADPGRVKLIHLRGQRELLHARLLRRTDHFMSPTLLDHQLADLEQAACALVADITATPEEIVALITRTYGLCRSNPA